MRIAAEILGSLAYLLLHFYPLALVYYLGASLRAVAPYSGLYYGVIAAGYAAGWVLLADRLRRSPCRQRKRLLFDRWLAAFFAALAVAGVLVYFNVPLRLSGWDAHGFGAMGGEANAVFVPWLQLGFWLFFKPRDEVSG